jgi:ATP-dependent exoDNAse (exonuclease V) beta subunit
VGARNWGEICILAPRRAWLPIVRGEFEAAGLKTALQMRRNRNGDNPAYAWLCGLLAVICDPENGFEWVGVLREVFAVSDGLMAEALPEGGRIEWDEPGDYPAPIRAALEVLGPFIGRADLEGDSLGRFAAELAAACRLAPKARRIDPDGAVEDELARLLARAAELGLGGAGPRAWLRELLGAIDEFRASGRAAPDAINMITSHSAKGLEWPVVIPLGLWREIVSREPRGLRIVAEWGGLSRVVFDNEGLGPETRESNERARLRELVRLLYVVLTRSKAALVIPWSAAQAPEKNSFATLWGFDPSWLDPLPLPAAEAAEPAEPEGSLQAPEALPDEPSSGPAPGFPARILPHELARAPDLPRAARHEASLDLPSPARDGADPLDYGVWWHEMLEFVPWAGDEAAVSAHAAAAVDRAGEKGFQDRAAAEWERFRASEPWHLLRNPRWTALAEVGVFAPLESGWIDGVIDLVLHDPLAAEVWIVDWKTNQRGAGESDEALLGRLAAEYQGQLAAYGTCTAGFFPTCKVRLWVYSTAAGAWTEVGAAS